VKADVQETHNKHWSLAMSEFKIINLEECEMAYNLNLPADTTAPAEIRENFRALKEDKIVAAATAVTADSATKLTNARVISLTGDATGSATFDGSADVSIAVDVVSADVSASCTGNAASATKLETARNINGVAFDGTKDITIKAESDGGNADTVDGKHASDFVAAGYGVPVGTVIYVATQTAPEGWLKADGSAISRTDYADLFAAVGTIFGAGDGSMTFNLPDLRGEFVRGFDDGRGVDSGRVLGSAQSDEYKSHTHSLSIGTTVKQGQAWNHDSWSYTRDNYYGSTTPNIIANGGTETRPRNVALLACIKY